jgi:hypothetical protein
MGSIFWARSLRAPALKLRQHRLGGRAVEAHALRGHGRKIGRSDGKREERPRR